MAVNQTRSSRKSKATCCPSSEFVRASRRMRFKRSKCEINSVVVFCVFYYVCVINVDCFVTKRERRKASKKKERNSNDENE